MAAFTAPTKALLLESNRIPLAVAFPSPDAVMSGNFYHFEDCKQVSSAVRDLLDLTPILNTVSLIAEGASRRSKRAQ